MEGRYAAAADGYKDLMSQEPLRVSAAIGMSEALSMEGKYAAAIDALESVSHDGEASAEWHLARRRSSRRSAGMKNRCNMPRRPTTFSRSLRRRFCNEAGCLKPWPKGRSRRCLQDYGAGRRRRQLSPRRTKPRCLGVDSGSPRNRHRREASEQAANILHNYFSRPTRRQTRSTGRRTWLRGFFCWASTSPTRLGRSSAWQPKLNKNIPDVHVGLGIVAISDWEFEQCLKHAGDALSINPNCADALLLKAICLMQWRKFDKVPPLLKRYSASIPIIWTRFRWRLRCTSG